MICFDPCLPLLAYWVAEMKLAPEAREVSITCRVPEPIMEKAVAGALSVTIYNYLASYLTRRIRIPSRGAA
jgi:hypothetical protein